MHSFCVHSFIHFEGQKKINLERFVPNEFAWEFARMESEWIPGAVMIALRDIEEGEEIFYDYEWESNINYIQYSQRGDILIDWPWYETVPQHDIEPLIEPWLSYRDFIGEIKKDWRLKKTDTIAVSGGSQETMQLTASEKDEQLLLEDSSQNGSGTKNGGGIMNGFKGLFAAHRNKDGGRGFGYIDDNVEPIPKPKVEKKERRRLIKKTDELSLDDEEVKLTSKKKKSAGRQAVAK